LASKQQIPHEHQPQHENKSTNGHIAYPWRLSEHEPSIDPQMPLFVKLELLSPLAMMTSIVALPAF